MVEEYLTCREARSETTSWDACSRVQVVYEEVESCCPVNFQWLQDPTISRELSLPVAAEIPFAQQKAALSHTKALGTARASLFQWSRSRGRKRTFARKNTGNMFEAKLDRFHRCASSGLATWVYRALFQSKVDELVPHAHFVKLQGTRCQLLYINVQRFRGRLV